MKYHGQPKANDHGGGSINATELVRESHKKEDVNTNAPNPPVLVRVYSTYTWPTRCSWPDVPQEKRPSASVASFTLQIVIDNIIHKGEFIA